MSRPPRRSGWATLPNAVTLLRLLLVVPITVLLLRHSQPLLTLALLVVFGASDWVDGFLARRLGQTSGFGAVFDPIADRLGVALIAIALVVAGHLPPAVAVLIALVDVVLGVVILIVRPPPPPVSPVGKLRTAVLVVGIACIGLGLLPGAGLASAIGQVVTAFGAVLHLIAGAAYVRTVLANRPVTP